MASIAIGDTESIVCAKSNRSRRLLKLGVGGKSGSDGSGMKTTAIGH